MLKLSFIFILTISTNSFAGWVTDFVSYDQTGVTDPEEISLALGYVQSARNSLLNTELTQSSKIKVTEATVSVKYSSWKNVPGEECQVANINDFKRKRFESSAFQYHSVSNSSEEWMQVTMVAPFVECTNKNGKKYIIKKDEFSINKL